MPISTITLHPSGRALLVALSDGGLSLYSTQDLAVVYSHSHEGPIKQAEFMNTDDVFLVSGSKARAAGIMSRYAEGFNIQQQNGWCSADAALGRLQCSAWCQAARYGMQGEAAARRSFAAQSTVPGSKIRAAQLLHDSVQQDHKSLYMAHSPASCMRALALAVSRPQRPPLFPPCSERAYNVQSDVHKGCRCTSCASSTSSAPLAATILLQRQWRCWRMAWS